MEERRIGKIRISRDMMEDILVDLFPDCQVVGMWFDFDTYSFNISLRGKSMPIYKEGTVIEEVKVPLSDLLISLHKYSDLSTKM